MPKLRKASVFPATPDSPHTTRPEYQSKPLAVQKLPAQVFKAAGAYAHHNAIVHRTGGKPVSVEQYYAMVLSGEAGGLEKKLNRQEAASVKAGKVK